MTMSHTMINGYISLRSADVTADDTAMDLSTGGERMTDITARDVLQLDPAWNGMQIIGWAEADENDTLGCELWMIDKGPHGRNIGLLAADLTGAAGTAWADMTNYDSTARLFLDDVSIKAGDDHHVKSIGIIDQGNNRVAKISLDTVGSWGLYARFYNVGGAGEVHRVNLWARPY